jgi:hypothetical protein
VSEERQNPPPITQKVLKELVDKALGSGVLDISNRTIDFDLDLVELLLECGQQRQANDKQYPSTYFVECPFKVIAYNSYFRDLEVWTTGEAQLITKGEDPPSQDTNIHFLEEVDFSRSHFEGDVCFMKSLFFKKVSFNGAEFENGNVHFYQVEFHKQVYFFWTKFHGKKVEFSLTDFYGQAMFFETLFNQGVSFDGIKVHQGASIEFLEVETHASYNFSPTLLNGYISIDKPKFESNKPPLVVDLERCSLESEGGFNFNNVEVDRSDLCIKVRNLKEDSNVTVHFKECGFYGKNVALTHVDMQQVSITGGNYVSGMAFYHCKWAKERPYFEFFKFPHTLFDMLEFRAMSFEERPSTEELMLIYAHLKTQAVEAGDMQLSNDFHFWQQFYQGQFQENQGFSWSNFYLYTSAYGTSVRLPLIWFTCVIVICMFLYTLLTKVPQSTLMFAFRTSIENSLPLIGWTRSSLFNTHPTQYLLLSIGQHLIQGYLLFQIGAAIRNKVKR